MTVYFIRRRNDPDRLIKIGLSTNFEQRLRYMATAHPEGFDVLCTVSGGRELEGYLHEKFSEDRVMREWFRPSVILLKFIADVSRLGVAALPSFVQAESVDDLMEPSAGVSEARRCLQYMAERHERYDFDVHAAYQDIAAECRMTFWAVKHLISGRAKQITVEKFDDIKRAYLNTLHQEKKALDARIERESSFATADFAGEILIMDQMEALAEKVRQAKGR